MRESGMSAEVDPQAAPTRKWLLRLVGLASLVALSLTAWLGLVVTPPDLFQGQLVRLLYVHPPIAWVAYLAFLISALASLLWLWPRTRSRRMDLLAGASAEVGVVFCGLTLVTGSIWGRPSWGVWWTWDALLTSTALMFVLYLGYLAVRRLPADETTQSRRSAVACLIAVVDLPINYMAATWWQTLHQQASIGNPESGTTVHGLMLETMLLGFVAFTLLYAWLVGHRMRTLGLERDLGDADLALALSERLTEIVGPAERPAGKPASTSLSGSRR